MIEDEFKKSFRLVKNIGIQRIINTRDALYTLLNEMTLEKKNISNEIRRSVYNFQISNKVKEKRIKYIDEIIIPRQNKHLESEMNEVFPEIKTKSLNRLRGYRRERERLLKITSDHSLRVKQNARILSSVYSEMDTINKQYAEINRAESVNHFFVSRKVNPAEVIEDDLGRYYEEYRKGGWQNV